MDEFSQTPLDPIGLAWSIGSLKRWRTFRFSLKENERKEKSQRIIHHICTIISNFFIMSSPRLCSPSRGLIHHSRQGDWAAVRVKDDHPACFRCTRERQTEQNRLAVSRVNRTHLWLNDFDWLQNVTFSTTLKLPRARKASYFSPWAQILILRTVRQSRRLKKFCRLTSIVPASRGSASSHDCFATWHLRSVHILWTVSGSSWRPRELISIPSAAHSVRFGRVTANLRRLFCCL